jgi:hypothetical protein
VSNQLISFLSTIRSLFLKPLSSVFYPLGKSLSMDS